VSFSFGIAIAYFQKKVTKEKAIFGQSSAAKKGYTLLCPALISGMALVFWLSLTSIGQHCIV
jgi:hypothetical protein